MNILYDTIIHAILHRFSDVRQLPPQTMPDVEGYRQSVMIVHANTTLAITAEMCPGPSDWITVIRFFSALRPGEQALFRINEYLSDDQLQFAWNRAKTFIITKIDESELFSFSLTEKPFVIEPPLMLPRSEIVDKLISATSESAYGRDH